MDLNYSASDDAFRAEVRGWLEANLPAEISSKILNHRRPNRDDLVRWHKLLAGRGWSAPHWPVQYGGTGWNATQRHIWDEENARVGAPGVLPFGVAMVAPVIMKYGSEEQKSYYLPRILDCTDWWCQGYSEPGSGSDLASLKTRAELTSDGKHYIVNGQKTWTTLGQHADMIFCLVRTDFEAKKQEGISFLLIDMKTPGITVRPIIMLDEEHEVNEVFFDNVQVPVENRVGEENRGWTYAKYLLGHERTGIARVGNSKRELGFLKRVAKQQQKNGRPLLEDPLFGAKVAALEIESDGAGADRVARGVERERWQGPRPRGIDAQDQGHRDPADADRADGGGRRPLRPAVRHRLPGMRTRTCSDRLRRRRAAGRLLLQLSQDLHLRRVQRNSEEHHQPDDPGAVRRHAI